MVLVQKWPLFNLFYLDNIGQENVFNDILERKNACLRYKNKKLKKSKNWDFSKGVNPWFWSKHGHFSKWFFKQYRPGKCLLRYSRTKKNLHDILEQKNTYLGYNNNKFKKSKNWHFSKGVNPWFESTNGHFSMVLVQKWKFFQLSFSTNMSQQNVFYDILERKNAFLGHKNKKF